MPPQSSSETVRIFQFEPTTLEGLLAAYFSRVMAERNIEDALGVTAARTPSGQRASSIQSIIRGFQLGIPMTRTNEAVLEDLLFQGVVLPPRDTIRLIDIPNLREEMAPKPEITIDAMIATDQEVGQSAPASITVTVGESFGAGFFTVGMFGGSMTGLSFGTAVGINNAGQLTVATPGLTGAVGVQGSINPTTGMMNNFSGVRPNDTDGTAGVGAGVGTGATGGSPGSAPGADGQAP